MKKAAISPSPANLSHPEMISAIKKIERRIDDLKAFDVDTLNDRWDPRIKALENSLDNLLVSVFGNETIEYRRYHSDLTNLDTAPLYMGRSVPLQEVRDGLCHGIERAITVLVGIQKSFEEEIQDAGSSADGKTLKAYDGLELHPAIERATQKLFKDGHYSNAIEDAVKSLNALVRLNSNIDDKDGCALMEYVFSPSNPILKINNLADQSDKDEQKGFMMMFSGAVAGLRNPRAHKIIKDDPEMTLEFIAFISLLAKFADKAER